MADRPDDSTAGYLAEYTFLTNGIRQNQRQRTGFFAFSLASNGVVLGILMRSTPPRTTTETTFLIALAAGVTLIAERMTISTTQAIDSATTYLRLFVEPHVEGLAFERRYRLFAQKIGAKASGAHGVTFAYFGLTAAFILAWPAAPLEGGRQWWQTAIVAVLGAASLVQLRQLHSLRAFGWNAAVNAWSAVKQQEQTQAPDEAAHARATHDPRPSA